MKRHSRPGRRSARRSYGRFWLAVLMIGLIGGGFGALMDVTGTAPQRTPTPVPPTATTTSVPPTPTTMPTATTRPTATLRARIGDEVRAGEIAYTVQHTTELGQTLGDVTTAGRWLQVDLAAVNHGATARRLAPEDLGLTDSLGRRFTPTTDLQVRVQLPDDVEWCNLDLPPSVPRRCVVIYELPTDARGLTLHVSNLQLLLGRQESEIVLLP